MLLAIARSAGLITDGVAATLGLLSKQLSTVAMAALGLEVRLKSLREAAPRVALTSALAACMMLILAAGALQLI
jgi:uncharacterized membrane protein YadS